MNPDVSNRPGELDRGVRFHIYRHFAHQGEAPAVADLASLLAVPAAPVEASLERLADAHMIALRPGSREIWMAHPFSGVPTAYPVETAERTYWANCAWDALGIPALLEVDAESPTECSDCGEAIAIRARGGKAEPSDAVVHFLVPPRRFWDDIGFT